MGIVIAGLSQFHGRTRVCVRARADALCLFAIAFTVPTATSDLFSPYITFVCKLIYHTIDGTFSYWFSRFSSCLPFKIYAIFKEQRVEFSPSLSFCKFRDKIVPVTYLSHALKRDTHSRHSPTRGPEYLCVSPHVHARVRSWCVHLRAYTLLSCRLFSAWERAAWDKNPLAVRGSEREGGRGAGGGSRRRRRRARIGWWRESGLGLCQMTLARTRPPRWWSREYFYHYRHLFSPPR